MFWIIFIGVTLISYIVSSTFKSKFNKYLQVPMPYGLSGAEVAAAMLRDFGIDDVKITVSHGFLSDHYNPATKTIALSPDVFEGRSIASAAVAAHETGHAVQHHVGYFWVQIRSGLVPIVQIGSQLSSILLLIGMFMLYSSPTVMLLGILAYATTVIFSFVTLPVEFDASRRALEWLRSKGLVTAENYAMAKDALKWAAMTYVVGALAALAYLVYYILMFLSVTSSDE